MPEKGVEGHNPQITVFIKTEPPRYIRARFGIASSDDQHVLKAHVVLGERLAEYGELRQYLFFRLLNRIRPCIDL